MTDDFRADKKAYYSRADVAGGYDAWRFRGAGGRFVDEVERQAILDLLAPVARDAAVLDLRGRRLVEGTPTSPLPGVSRRLRETLGTA